MKRSYVLRGMGEAAMRSSRSVTKASTLRAGSLVFTNDEAGIGKFETCEGSTATVRLFYSIARQETRSYPTGVLWPAILAPQTRVYVQRFDESWVVGRVEDRNNSDGEVLYDILLPNGKFLRVPE